MLPKLFEAWQKSTAEEKLVEQERLRVAQEFYPKWVNVILLLATEKATENPVAQEFNPVLVNVILLLATKNCVAQEFYATLINDILPLAIEKPCFTQLDNR